LERLGLVGLGKQASKIANSIELLMTSWCSPKRLNIEALQSSLNVVHV
jgi:hypothetical protein